MPCSVQIASNPFLDSSIVFLAILDVLHLPTVALEILCESCLATSLELGVTQFKLTLVVGKATSNFSTHLVTPQLCFQIGFVIEETGIEFIAVNDIFLVANVNRASGVWVSSVSA